jgi:hypothetical protein
MGGFAALEALVLEKSLLSGARTLFLISFFRSRGDLIMPIKS